MYGSRRFWTTAALGGLLAGLAVGFERPEPLVGAAAIGAWLLAAQLLAIRDFRLAADLDVTYEADRRRASVEQPIRCRLALEREIPGITVDATAPVPVAAQGPNRSARRLTLDAGETRATTTFELSLPVAGRFEFDRTELRLTDRFGLFTETVHRGNSPTIEVSARAPSDIHVGRGGERIIAAFGEHATDQRGAGLQPEELRRYVAGDSADSIDWKATARLREPYVREYQAETDRETLLVVDHRATMNRGRGGETMLAYAREVALAVAESAVTASDPLGLYAVGDEGLTARRPPTTAPGGYSDIRSRLQSLEATIPAESRGEATRPARARAARKALTSDESQFAQSVRPFLASTDSYVRRLAGDPLFSAVKDLVTDADSNQWTVIVTSDADPVRLRETVKLAAGRSAAVLVFLTPAVLYDSDSDIESAYDRYVEFEELRRELDRIPRVSAFEVGPGDRVQRLLANRRARTAGI